MIKRALFIGLVALSVTTISAALVLAADAASKSGNETAKNLNLFFGSTNVTSGYYTWSVAVARAINKYSKGISITVVESGATYDNVKKIREGIFHGGLSEGMQGAYEMYRGLETFKGKAWEPIRFFFMRNVNANRFYVLSDSKIKTWSDLAGKKVYAGMPGSAAAKRVQRSNDLLGTGLKLVPGSLSDAIKDLQTGRLEAAYKSGPVYTFDAAMMAAHQSTPLRAIGFNAEEAAKLAAKYPQFLVTKTPANSIKLVPGHDSFYEIYALGGSHTSAKLPQGVGYRIVKSVYEHWNEIKQAYPSSTDDMIADYVKLVPPGLEVPLHAGTVQYAEEIGIKIPKHLIPPEYKP